MNVVEELKKLITQVEFMEGRVHELDSIRATLEVNCQPGRSLSNYGCKYDENKTIHDNMFHVLETLVTKLDDKTGQVSR